MKIPSDKQMETPLAERDFAARQTLGGRRRQEDFFAFADFDSTFDLGCGVLGIVADGMGGHFGGSLASRRATQTFADEFRKREGTVPERLLDALHAANHSLILTPADIPSAGALVPSFMGTTLVAMTVFAGQLRWISVGDSPLYLFRDGEMRRLNADHSFRTLIEESVQAGQLTPEQGESHPNRHMLRSALTGFPIELIDQSFEDSLPLRANDLLLCASDGLLSLTEAAMKDVVYQNAEKSAAEIAELLIETTIESNHPAQDNTTVMVFKALAFLPQIGA